MQTITLVLAAFLTLLGHAESLIDTLGGIACAEQLHYLTSPQWLYSMDDPEKTGLQTLKHLACGTSGCAYSALSKGGFSSQFDDHAVKDCPFSGVETPDISTQGQLIVIKLLWDLNVDKRRQDAEDPEGGRLIDELRGNLALSRSDRKSVVQLLGILVGVDARPSNENRLIYIPLSEWNEKQLNIRFTYLDYFLQGLLYEYCEGGVWHNLVDALENEMILNVLFQNFTLQTALQWIEDAALSLDRLHANGVSHWDTMGDNIFLCRRPTTANNTRIFSVLGDLGLGSNSFSDPLSGSWDKFISQRHTDHVRLTLSIVELLQGEQLPDVTRTKMFQDPDGPRCIVLDSAHYSRLCREEGDGSDFTKLSPIPASYFSSLSRGWKAVHWNKYIGQLLIISSFSGDTWSSIQTRRHIESLRSCVARFDAAHFKHQKGVESFGMLSSGELVILQLDVFDGLTIFLSGETFHVPLHSVPCMDMHRCITMTDDHCLELETSVGYLTICFMMNKHAVIWRDAIASWGRCDI